MTWEYALIGLVVGIIIGAVAMRFGNRKLRQQQALQYELEKNKAELDEYREELVRNALKGVRERTLRKSIA